MLVMPLSSNLQKSFRCLISSTHQCTQLPPYPPVSLWSSIRSNDLAGTPCINNCMNITVLSAHSVPCHSGLGECRFSCKFAGLMTRFFWGHESKRCGAAHVGSNIIARESSACAAALPCLVDGNLSGIHSNTTEFGASKLKMPGISF